MLHIFSSSLLQISLVKNYVTDYTNAQISKKEKKKNKEKNRNANSLDIKNNCAQTYLTGQISSLLILLAKNCCKIALSDV